MSRNPLYGQGHVRAGRFVPTRLRCLYIRFLVGKENKFSSHLSILWESRAAEKGRTAKKSGGWSEPAQYPLHPWKLLPEIQSKEGTNIPSGGRNIPRTQSWGCRHPPGHPSAGFCFGKLLPPQGHNTETLPKTQIKIRKDTF